MGLLGFRKQEQQQQPVGSNFNVNELNINNCNHDWAGYYHGDFSNFPTLTEEDVEAAERTEKEMEVQQTRHTRRNKALSNALEKAKTIANNEEYHSRVRIGKITTARAHHMRTQSFIAEKIAPELHEQNEGLSLAQAKGKTEMDLISATFNQRHQSLQAWKEVI